MSSLRYNLVANFGGSAWTALMGFLFVPLYIKFIGIEAYGLIGLFFVMQALFAVMDMGLSATASREIARLYRTARDE
jgi:O-antigen/teichoic acid export membrane protein